MSGGMFPYPGGRAYSGGGGSFGPNTWSDATATIGDTDNWSLAGDVWTVTGGYGVLLSVFQEYATGTVVEVQMQMITNTNGFVRTTNVTVEHDTDTVGTDTFNVEIDANRQLAFQSFAFNGTLRIISVREVL